MFLNPWYSTVGRRGDDSAVPTSSPSASDSGSVCPSPPLSVADVRLRTDTAGLRTVDPLRTDAVHESDSVHSSTTASVTSAEMAAAPSALRPHWSAPSALTPGWSAHRDNSGRCFYCNEDTRSSSWLPPQSLWNSCRGLPYGWEMAVDSTGVEYFINHLNRTTTYHDPRQEDEPVPDPRHVTLQRHPALGFGFVAGSEKPVIVRFVTEGGPSVDKLMPGDQILCINGEDVKFTARDRVIEKVRSCLDQMDMIVCQPPLDNSSRKSALLSATKKQRLKSRPSRVRFAEGIVVNGHSSLSPFLLDETCVPFMPNVLKVFLENGQTKSFKYNSSTTVLDVLESLQLKLGMASLQHFGIVVEQVNCSGHHRARNRLLVLDDNDTLAKIASRPGAHNLRCLLRVVYVPKDAEELLKHDPVTFEYLYLQCCTDVVQERFAPELKYDTALQLAALHIHQHVVSNNLQCKITVKNVEREYGLQRFVPASLLTSMKRKELWKLLAHMIKLHQQPGPGQPRLTPVQAKLLYLSTVSQLPSYGAKCYSATFDHESGSDSVLLVSPRLGISRINGFDNEMPVRVCEMDRLSEIEVTTEDDGSWRLHLILKQPESRSVMLLVDERDAPELILVICGYYRLQTGRTLSVKRDQSSQQDDSSPPYHAGHVVSAEGWSYGRSDDDASTAQPCRTADFSLPPPYRQLGADPVRPQPAPGSSSVRPHPFSLMLNPAGSVDGNMNRTKERNANVSISASAGDVEDDGEELEPDHDPADFNSVTEACNQQVLDRLVADAESYLAGGEVDGDSDSLQSAISRSESDTGGVNALRHSDSLLLLAQLSKDRLDGVETVKLGSVDTATAAEHRSASDTDSEPSILTRRTPEPQKQPAGGRAGVSASFGLRSPIQESGAELKDYVASLRRDGQAGGRFPEGSLYLDPDLIDLTSIPPPSTPEQELSAGGYSVVRRRPVPELSTPPTPFSDRLTLERQQQLLMTSCRGDLDVLVPSTVGHVNGVTCISPVDSPSSGISSQPPGSDIDSLIASLTLPPPPSNLQLRELSTVVGVDDGSPVVELTRDQIASFIIPPPPGSSSCSTITPTWSDSVGGCDVMYAVNPVASCDEVQINPTTTSRPPRVASKIAVLQRKLQWAQHTGVQLQRTMLYASDQKLEVALEENAVLFGALQRTQTVRPDLRHASPPLPPKCGGAAPALPPLPPKPVTSVRMVTVSESGDRPPALPIRQRRQPRPAVPSPPMSPQPARHRRPPPPAPDPCSRLSELCRQLDDDVSPMTSLGVMSSPVDSALFEQAHSRLSTAARQLVTACKLLVQQAAAAAADGSISSRRDDCVWACVTLADRCADSVRLACRHAGARRHVGVLPVNLRETCGALLLTVRCVLGDADSGDAHAHMDRLTEHATLLAAALTALMRSLKLSAD